METYHVSVLLREVIEALRVQPGKQYIDATLGGGGHSLEIIQHGGVVLGIDADEEAILEVKKILRDKDIKTLGEKKENALHISVSQYPNISLVRGNFKDIDTIAKTTGFERVDGILFDLGVSSHQLEEAERGFSFRKEGPLDMRMDQGLQVRARELVNGLGKGELYELLTKLGEEQFARSISAAIVEERKKKPIETTGDLEKIVRRAVPVRGSTIHPATRVFQALRIAVNDELHSIREALPKAFTLLNGGGRIAVISFHSLEDRIVKNYFREIVQEGRGRLVKEKPIIPSDTETEHNPRSRSAKLRIIEKNI